MIEQIEDDSWTHAFDLPTDDPLTQRLIQEAARNGRTVSEQFAYEWLVQTGRLKPSSTQ